MHNDASPTAFISEDEPDNCGDVTFVQIALSRQCLVLSFAAWCMAELRGGKVCKTSSDATQATPETLIATETEALFTAPCKNIITILFNRRRNVTYWSLCSFVFKY